MIRDDLYNAVVTDRNDLNEYLSILRLRPVRGAVPPFEPGQFIQVGLPKREPDDRPRQAADAPARPRLLRRVYSIASPATQRDYVELFLARVAYGQLTPRLWDVPVGGGVWLDDKASGHFTLQGIPAGADLVMVASGTGVAPFASMVRTFQEQPPWQHATLINGCRHAVDLGYRAEFEQRARNDERFRYIPVVSREEPESWPGLHGRVQQVFAPGAFERLTGRLLSPAQVHVMLCGNPEMISDMEALLKPLGFTRHTRAQPGNLHYERYW